MTEERPQRRLAAILVSDVVGYTAMMERDEAGTHARLKQLRRDIFHPVTARNGGRTFKLTGDGALIEFGSAYDAAKCAIEVQDEMSRCNADLPEAERILLRMGISLGDVIVEGDDLYGNGVNVAARMEALAEPGEICISQNVHEHIAHAMDLSFIDLGEQTVKGLGRTVRAYRLAPASANGAEGLRGGTSATVALPAIPSIAVLPFQNMSGDPDQEFFADGMTEDIITGLSHYRSLFVIARNSTFAYKGQSPDLRHVARDLGVRYVLEGSIRKGGARIRATAQLIDGTSGAHIWADRWDRELTDIFAVQDEITGAIVAAIGPEIDQVERERARRLPPGNLAAWESYQRGLWHLYRFNREDNAEAQRLFRQAASAGGFAAALAGLTHALYYAYMHGYVPDQAATLAEAYQTAQTAVATDDRDADAHFALGRILYLKHDLDASMAEFEEAIGCNPSFAHAHHGLATALLFAGRWAAAIESCDRAIRFSPHDPTGWITLVVKALAHLGAGDLDGAEAVARKAARLPTAEFSAHVALTAILGHRDKPDDAAAALADLRRIMPAVSHDDVRRILAYRDPEDIGHVVDGLRKAGLEN